MKINPPKEEVEERTRRAVIFWCMKKENNRIMNPLLKEIQPIFQKLMDEVEFCSRGGNSVLWNISLRVKK